MANRDFGNGGRGGQYRDYDRDYDRDRFQRDRDYDRGYFSGGVDREYDRGWREGRGFQGGPEGRYWGAPTRDYGESRDYGGGYGGAGPRDWSNERGWQGSGWQGAGGSSGGGYARDYGFRGTQGPRYDLGDRNPSQGFTGGYGGAFGSRYAEAGDRIGEPRAWETSGGTYGGTFDRGNEALRRGFAGRGPRNYRRSDARIEEDVNEALMRNDEIDASDVEVRVENAVVTLNGEVEDRHAKRLAEDIAERVPGVRDVHNALKARHGFWDSLFGGDDRDREERDREERTRRERELTPSVHRENAGATAGTTTGTTNGGSRATTADAAATRTTSR
jgi:osmotically-inducible protein OsmY